MKKVCVQGLGFVGSAIAVALAEARDVTNQPVFDVTGIDLPNEMGKKRVDLLNQGLFPFSTNDNELKEATLKAVKKNNFRATFDLSCYQNADYILVSLPFNLNGISEGKREFQWENFKDSIKQFAKLMKPNCLVIVETTVPPGTCRKIVLPILKEEFLKREIDIEPLLSHSYERVMPGENYLRSISDFYRCYSGLNEHSANLCKDFLSKFICTEKYPLTKLESLESSEIAKVLENSYRAVTIAFMEEWSEFSEKLNVNLYEIINAIRMRPTHSNMRQPGFGVGGYCLTKDPLFAEQAAKEIYDFQDISFPFCELAVKTNQYMPKRCFKKLKSVLGKLSSKKLLLMGVSYKSDVGDTRFSPSEQFIQEAYNHDMVVTCHDPLVSYWDEMNLQVETDLNKINYDQFDVVVIAVPHAEYKKIDFSQLISNSNILLFDAFGMLDETQKTKLNRQGNDIFVIGQGEVSVV